MIKEIWKPIKGYENRYEVSDQGNIKSLLKGYSHEAVKRNTPLIRYGYMENRYKRKVIYLYLNGIRTKFYIAHLVLKTFGKKQTSNSIARFKDNNPENCSFNNLYWGFIDKKQKYYKKTLYGKTNKTAKQRGLQHLQNME
jgi:hypothetical protein